jgi:hypothetical protein
MNEKLNLQVGKRWMYHMIININIFSMIFFILFSLFSMYYGLFCFEGSMVVEDVFYKNSWINLFDGVPHGKIIDLCTSEGNIDNYFNFTSYYSFYDNLVEEGIKIQNTYSTTPLNPVYDSFKNKVDSMKINSFEAVENRKIKWEPDSEQINYFLYPLSTYKYFTPRKS